MDEHEVNNDALERENKYLLRVLGALGTALLAVSLAFLSFWIDSVSSKTIKIDSQLIEIWRTLNTRGERLQAIEQRLTFLDETTKGNSNRVTTLETKCQTR